MKIKQTINTLNLRDLQVELQCSPLFTLENGVEIEYGLMIHNDGK